MIGYIWLGSSLLVLVGSILCLRASKAVLRLAQEQEARNES